MNDLYSKVVLTVIAGCLVALVAIELRRKPAEPQQLADPLPVTIAGIEPLGRYATAEERYGWNPALPVRIVPSR